MDAIHEHVFNITRVKVASLPLTRIGTPLVFMSHEGKIKVGWLYEKRGLE